MAKPHSRKIGQMGWQWAKKMPRTVDGSAKRHSAALLCANESCAGWCCAGHTAQLGYAQVKVAHPNVAHGFCAKSEPGYTTVGHPFATTASPSGYGLRIKLQPGKCPIRAPKPMGCRGGSSSCPAPLEPYTTASLRAGHYCKTPELLPGDGMQPTAPAVLPLRLWFC